MRLLAVAAGALWLDLWSKQWAFQSLDSTETRPFIQGFVDFRRSLNDGAVFGSFRGNTGLFIIASVFALVFVLYLFKSSATRQRFLHVALGLVLAGALGNLYDRATVKADVVTYQTRSGRAELMIGLIVNQDEQSIHVADYPDKGNVRILPRDRVTVRNQGVVRDFIKFRPRFPNWVPKLGGYDMWPWVFNIADASLVCGVILLLLSTWLDRSGKPEAQ
ncbi:MAG: signal peptidase II [Phycisphaerae bacterium]